MSGKLFKTIKAEFQECNMLPERAKEMLNSVDNSLNDLDKNNFNQLWIVLQDFILEKSSLEDEDTIQDKELLTCYNCIIKLINHVMNCTENILCVYENDYLLKTILIFQKFYPKNFKYMFKLEIIKMNSILWKLIGIYQAQNGPLLLDYDQMLTKNFILTFNYVFETIEVITKKNDMKILSSILYEFCKVVVTLSSNANLLDLIVLHLKKSINNTLFLETETGKIIIAEIFTTSQQLFLKFHQTVKKLLPKVKKSNVEAYGEIYFIAWINSNASMREVIEQQGILDLISKSLLSRRTGLALRIYHNALLLLHSIQNHRKHLMFSKVITKLYAPVLWRQLSSEYRVVRCNAIEILARAYPLEKRGEGREVASRFLIKQQDAFLDLLEDPCPQVRIAAIKGICSCMRYFWDSFEEDRLNKCFSLFKLLVEESVYEVRRVIFYGFCQILDESKSHRYFKDPIFKDKIKNTLNDENEKVRRAFIHFLLKVKNIDIETESENKINFADIVNLTNTAAALAREDKQNGLLLVDLIFDNFMGEKVPNRQITLMRFNIFYKINPMALRKLIMYSEKVLDFDSACNLILSLLKTVYITIKKKEERLQETDKENDIPPKNAKRIEDSINMSVSSRNSSVNNNEEEHTNICCIMDCVYCLMVVHRHKFIDENNHKQMKDIQEACTSCLVKLLRFYKEGDAYFSAMNLASLIPISKLTSHITASSAALSTLKQLPYDLEKEDIDMRKVDCLVNTLCMWKRGYEILQFVNVWFDEAFKTLNLNDTQYPDSKIQEGKKVRFQTDIEECKPMTGIMLINTMLTNFQTQKTLLDSDVNKKNIHDLITYLQRVKPAIENRLSSDNILNNLLSDEVLIELFHLHMRLYILYYSRENNLDKIITYQTSILDWVINNLLIHDLHNKNENTVIFAAKIVNIVNNMVTKICLMSLVNNTFLDYYCTFCVTMLHNYLGSRVLISMIETLINVSKHFYYLKLTKDHENNLSILTNCVCSIISILCESKFNEERFKNIIGEPSIFRRTLAMMLLEINKTSIIEFKQIFMTLVETVISIIANQIREINEIDLIEQLTEMPFGACQLTMVILGNIEFRKYFSSNSVIFFSSEVYKNDPVLLLSEISYIYTLAFQLDKKKGIDLEPVVKMLYKFLMEYDKTTVPLGNNCTINNTKSNQELSILETSDFSNELPDFKQKGRAILISTAKKLRINLSE